MTGSLLRSTMYVCQLVHCMAFNVIHFACMPADLKFYGDGV